MTGQKRSPAARAVAGAAALAALILAGVVVYHVAVRRDEPPGPAAEAAPLDDGPVDRKEKIRHREYLDGRPAVEVRADRFFQDPDGRRHLEGGVEVKDFDRKGKVLSVITADSIIYDPELTRFEISGRVTVTLEDVILEGGYFEYDKAGGTFATPLGGSFSSAGMAGAAAAISHDLERDEISLSGGFRIVREGRPQSAQGMVLTGETLRFLRTAGRGWVDGGARLQRGPIDTVSETLSFSLGADGEAFDSVRLSGSAEARLIGAAEEGSGRRTLDAGTITLTFLPPGERAGMIEADGDARLIMPLEDGGKGRLAAATIKLDLGESEEVLKWTAAGGFSLQIDGADGSGRTLEGERASGDGEWGALVAEGRPDRPAVVDTERLKIEATTVALRNSGRDLDASGDIRCLIKSHAENTVPGFFRTGAPVFATARSMMRRDPGVIRFEGAVRIWQDGRRLEAQELDLDENSGQARAKGQVTASFPARAENGKDAGAAEAGGDEMAYSPERRTLAFRGRGFAMVPGARLAAREVLAVVGETDGGLEAVAARDDVVISRGGYEGRSREARYDAADGLIVLAGRPVLVDRNGRVSRGSKLTFDLADGRIRLENEGQERSITVIKS